MKKYTLKLIIVILPLSIFAQNTDCARMMQEADVLAKNKDFQKAINKYTAAATCDPKLQQQVSAKINDVFVLVEKEKDAAIQYAQEANKQRKIAEEKTELAERNGNQSKANELAATAREIWASEHDSITALRLAEAAIKVSTPPTPRAIESMRDIATAAFTQPVKSYNLIKRFVHSDSDIDFLSIYPPFSPCLKYFITNTLNVNSIRVWQLSNGQNIKKFAKPNESIVDFVFSQNDEYAMMRIIENGGKSREDVRFLVSGELLISYSDSIKGSIGQFFFLDNKPMLFYQSDSLFKILDISKKSEINSIPQIKNFHASTFQFSVNGNRLIMGGTITQDGTPPKPCIKIWDLEKNIYCNEVKPNKRFVAYNISKDNRFLVVANIANAIDIIDLESNQIVKTLVGHNSKITNLTFSDDNKFLVSGDNSGQVKFWSIEWGISIQTFNIQTKQDVAYHIAISSDNKNIFTYSLATVNTWRTIVDILDKKNSPTLTEEERLGYGVPDWVKD